MFKLRLLMVLFSVLLLGACETRPKTVQHGEFQEPNSELVWNDETKKWVSPIDFWLYEAKMRGGLTWGLGSVYPDYHQVAEFDTFLVELPSGKCLMAFYPSRWRRANDVWRWDDAFNDYSACPDVFD